MESKEVNIVSNSAEAFKQTNTTNTNSNEPLVEASLKEIDSATKDLNPDKNSLDSRG